jgi:two-component system sensor histidine kinase/response regulator
MFRELLSRDREDGCATGQSQGVGSEAYLNGTSQGPTPEDARKDGHIRGRSRQSMKYPGIGRQPTVSHEKSTILIVDDDPINVAIIEEILESVNCTWKSVATGEETLKILDEFTPDLVLLDIMLPGIDGYEVCQRLKERQSSSSTKIILVSGRAMVEERLRGYKVGADDYVTKPFDEEELLAKVRVFLRLKAVEDELRTLNETLREQVLLRSRQLLQAEKMAALGRHAAGIVHNLNNPLQVIMGNIQLLAMDRPDDQAIEDTSRAAEQMKKIIGTILTTSRRETLEEISEIDLNEVLRDQLELLKANRLFKHEITTELDLKPLPPYHGIYAHFSQSFGNVLKNAVDAMYDTGVRILSISTEVQDSTIVVKISDTGCGIPEEHLDRVFDSFFTTKPLLASGDRPVGTGLGLASCREMIESYGGRILVTSAVTKSTTVTILLPLVADAAFLP